MYYIVFKIGHCNVPLQNDTLNSQNIPYDAFVAFVLGKFSREIFVVVCVAVVIGFAIVAFVSCEIKTTNLKFKRIIIHSMHLYKPIIIYNTFCY